MINKLLLSERSKWIFIIGVVGVGAGLTAKNVISYPTEWMKEELVRGVAIRNEIEKNSLFFSFFSL